ncbi:hypothetical protein [Actinomadura craniellae]|nr:hypothetical protein [Actinomadura craniellae]
MTVTLADLTARTGLDVLDHLEREATVPVIDGLQAQGDLIVVPLALVAGQVAAYGWAHWRAVPPEGVELLRSASGGNPHTLVADPGACRWTTNVGDAEQLALGMIEATGPAYLIHPEHGGTGLAPGSYVIRRQREGTRDVPRRRFGPSAGASVWLIAD